MKNKLPEIGKLRRAPIIPQLRSIDEENRTIEFVASTEAVDRYGDIIRVKGWKTKAYMKNPVVLFGHRSDEPPIGRTVECYVENDPPALVQVVQFTTEKENPFGAQIFNSLKGGYLSACSVGFRPTKPPKLRTDEDTGQTVGYEFIEQELMELSVVPIPANPEALARALTKGDMSEEFVTRCGFRNPSWSKLVPGVTYCPEDEEPKEEVKSVSSNEVTEGLQDLVKKLCKTDEAVTQLAAISVKRADLAEVATATQALHTRIEGLVNVVKTMSEVIFTKADLPELSEAVEGVRKRVEKMHAEAVKDTLVTDVTSRVDEIRQLLNKMNTVIVKAKELGDVSARIDGARTAIERLEAYGAKSSDVSDVLATVTELSARVLTLTASHAKSAQLATVLQEINELKQRLSGIADIFAKDETVLDLAGQVSELRARFDGFAVTAATKSDIAELTSKFDEGCRRLDGLVEKIAQLSLVIKQRAAQPAVVESCACPFTDDEVAISTDFPETVLGLGETELRKNATPVGWRRMSTVVVGDPASLASYRLAHHVSNGFKVIPGAVREALEKFEQTAMPAADRADARSHLVKHLVKIAGLQGLVIDVTSFELRMDELGRVYRSAEAQGDTSTTAFIADALKKHVASVWPVPSDLKKPVADPMKEFENSFLRQ